MNSITLQHRAAAAGAAIDNARTPAEKHAAKAEGLSVYAALAKHLADEQALAAFSKAKPQSMVGVWKGEPIADHPVHMVRADGKKIVAPVTLPDGSQAKPNPQYQIVVPAHHAAEMQRRGFVQANAVITPLGEKYPIKDPAIPDGTAP